MIYLLQTTFYAALLFAIYLLLLRHRAAHAWSRAWLLMCAMLPFAIPFISIPGVQATLPPAAAISAVELPFITIWGGQAVAGTTSFAWLPLVYAGICALLLGRILAQYIWFARFVRRHTHQTIDGAEVIHDDGVEPGSFGRYIFLPGTDTDAAILQHELAHIKLRHSADIIIVRLLQAVFWPNVILYVIAHELRLVHEFQADAQSAANKDSYIAMLLNSTFGTNRFSLSHTFFHHPLKRRIMMLQRSAPDRKGALAIALKTCGMASVLLAGIIFLQSCQQKSDQAKPTTNQAERTGKPSAEDRARMTTEPGPGQVTPTDNIVHTADGRDVYKAVEKAPTTGYDLMQYLATHINYPASAKKAGVEGKAIVKFIVDENGNVADAKVLNEVDPALAAEAVRVVSTLPKWTPGEHQGKKVSVFFHLPIAFRLK